MNQRLDLIAKARHFPPAKRYWNAVNGIQLIKEAFQREIFAPLFQLLALVGRFVSGHIASICPDRRIVGRTPRPWFQHVIVKVETIHFSTNDVPVNLANKISRSLKSLESFLSAAAHVPRTKTTRNSAVR